MPIVTVDGIGFGVGTWWNNESVILLFLDGAALTVKLLQDLVGLFTTHDKNKGTTIYIKEQAQRTALTSLPISPQPNTTSLAL